MKQTTFADSGLQIVTKNTRMRIFQEEINTVVRWASLVGIIQGYTPMAKPDQPLFPIEVMLRIHFVQFGNNYSDLRRKKLCTTWQTIAGLLAWSPVPPAC